MALNPSHPDPGVEARGRAVRRVLWATLGLNLAVCALKAALGVLSGSVALLADAIHALFDSVSNVVGLTATALSARPPDEDHPYGHGKIEVAATLFIGILIAVGLFGLGKHAVEGFLDGTAPEVTPWTLAAVTLSLGVNLGVSAWERREGKRLGSSILTADAAHTASDALATLAVLAGLGLSLLGVPGADLLAALVVIALVGATAWKIIRDALHVLVDTSRIPPDEVRQVAHRIPGLRSCHNIRSRGMDGHVHLDLHVTFDPHLTLHTAGEGMLALRRDLHERFPEVRDIVIQLEPHLPVFLND